MPTTPPFLPAGPGPAPSRCLSVHTVCAAILSFHCFTRLKSTRCGLVSRKPEDAKLMHTDRRPTPQPNRSGLFGTCRRLSPHGDRCSKVLFGRKGDVELSLASVASSPMDSHRVDFVRIIIMKYHSDSALRCGRPDAFSPHLHISPPLSSQSSRRHFPVNSNRTRHYGKVNFQGSVRRSRNRSPCQVMDFLSSSGTAMLVSFSSSPQTLS